jgi:hypothetical protein
MLIPVIFNNHWSKETGLSGEHPLYEIAMKTKWRPRGFERLKIDEKTVTFLYDK